MIPRRQSLLTAYLRTGACRLLWQLLLPLPAQQFPLPMLRTRSSRSLLPDLPHPLSSRIPITFPAKVAIIYKNDDNYSKGIHDTFVAEAAAKSLAVVYEGTFDDSNAQDFTVQLGKAQEAGADILFLPIYYDPASLILTQANGMGYKPTFFGVDGMDGILGLEGFDTSLAEGVYLLTPFSADATDELTVNFVNKYKEKFGEVPNQFAADAYDCIYAIAQACEAAGVTADMSSADICAKLVEQFTSMTFSGLTGSEMTWNANGEVTKSPKAVVIQNGVYVGVED